jgi:hypothetical protein
LPQQNVFIKYVIDNSLRATNFTWQNEHPLSPQDPVIVQTRVLDVASIVATASGQYDWICSDYNTDTVHESQVGCLAIAESGIIDPYALTR